jgi:hypothetical protein
MSTFFEKLFCTERNCPMRFIRLIAILRTLSGTSKKVMECLSLLQKCARSRFLRNAQFNFEANLAKRWHSVYGRGQRALSCWDMASQYVFLN